MKRIIMFLLLFAALKVAGQTTGYLRYDTVKIMKQNGTCELYVINKTKDSLGILTNVGGGLTSFKRSRQLNDTTIVVGNDTLTIIGRGGGISLSNTGTGFRWVTTPNGSIKSAIYGYGLNGDSTTNAGSITVQADTTEANHLVTTSQLKDTAEAIRAAGGGSGVTDGDKGDVIVTGSGSTWTLDSILPGNKLFNSKRTRFYGGNGLAPRVNTQYAPSAVVSDSLYVSNKYLGFGFIDQFSSGVIVQCYVQSDNHVGDNAHVKMRKSFDQGRTWTTSTIDTGSTGYFVTGLSGGVTHSNRLVVFLQRINSSGGAFIDQRIMYSDDEGATFSAQTVVSSNGETIFQPYGPLVKMGNNELLLSWYGSTGSTYSSYVIKSSDDGATWGSPIAIMSSSASQRTETSVMYLGGSTLIAIARGEQVDSAYGQYISRDNGSTWTYQGITSFGQSGTPAWTKVFKGKNGKLICVAYYKSGAYQSPIKATYGYADSIGMGPSGWNVNSTKTVVASMRGNGYIQVAHPNLDMHSIATYYDETTIIEDATIKYVNIPLTGDFPLQEKWEDVAGGASYNAGYIGIGNTAPEARLHVNGAQAKTGSEETVQILSSGNSSNPLVMDFNMGNNATAGSRFGSIQVVERGVAMRPLLLNPSGGNVGINVSTPALSPLHVNAATGATGTYSTRIIDNNSSIGTHLVLGNTALGFDAKYKGLSVDANGLNIGTLPDALNAATTAVMTIDNSTFGRVGFGVTSPLASIHIKSGSTFGGTAPIAIDSGALMTTPQPGRLEYNGNWWVTDRAGVRTQFNGSQWSTVTGGINFAGGKVGINNATPDAQLSVVGLQAKAGSEETIATFNSSDASQPLSLWLNMGNNATAGSRGIGFQSIESGVGFRSIWLNPDGGNVTIGTRTSTGAKLTVSGQATVTDDAYDATTWNGNFEVPTKNAIRDKIESMSTGGITSINSHTGPAITVQGGTGISVDNSVSNTATIEVTPNSSALPHTLDAVYATAGNTGTGETDLFTYTLPAGELAIDGRTMNFEIDGEFNDNTITAQLRLYFAGNVTLNTGAVSVSTAFSKWRIKGYIMRTSSSTAHVTYEMHAPGLATPIFLSYNNLTSLDFTTTNVFKISAQAAGGGASNSDITAHSWQLLYKPQPQ